MCWASIFFLGGGGRTFAPSNTTFTSNEYKVYIVYIFTYTSSFSIGTTTLSWVSALLNCRAFSAGRFYRVTLPEARPTPKLEENQGFRAFQLSPQEAPSVSSDASEPSSGRWNYGREKAEKFCRKWRLPRHFWVLLHAVKHRHIYIYIQ
jgi:hypothetical protein